ncbi:BRIX domain containing protein [Spraguea lophii 42_110]|uniref:BRIX domain containing protein n=1 Tax=Spraguea lophii (strain 42_110) TaxID=1358809 RepID=S7W5R1_SPRLO|nr:BRIX domain containing protein [Spraguea lophii 42_110]
MLNFILPDNPSPQTLLLCKDLKAIMNGNDMNIKISEDCKKPFRFILLSGDEKIIFRIIEYKSTSELRRASIKQNNRELVVSNFTSELGNIIVNWFIKIFPITNNNTNEIISLTNSEDYIFLRVNRYKIESKENVILQDIGFHMTLRVERIKLGTQNMKIKFKEKHKILTEK